METVFISTSMPGRARPDYFFALAESFYNKGYRVVLIIDGRPKALPYHEKLILYRWPNKRPTGVADFKFLRKLIIKYRPSTLISSFGSVNVMNICGFLMRIKNRVNYILSVSEPFFEKPNFFDILKRNFLKTRKIFVYHLGTLIIYNSIGTKNDSKVYYKLKNKNYLVLRNLITSTKQEYISKEERKHEIIIVGNLIKRKGHFFLIKQFKEALNKFPELRLIIVGQGLERKTLEQQVVSMGLSKNVKFVGTVPNRKIAEYFSKSLISISSSTHEAFGFINIEAMREGTPIISTRTAGGLDIVKQGENGCFFDLNTQESLAKAIEKIINNWDCYSIQARNSFINLYLLENQIDIQRDMLISKFK